MYVNIQFFTWGEGGFQSVFNRQYQNLKEAAHILLAQTKPNQIKSLPEYLILHPVFTRSLGGIDRESPSPDPESFVV